MATVTNSPSARMAMRFATPHTQEAHETRAPREGAAGGGSSGGMEKIPFGDYLPAGSAPGDYTPGHGGGFLGLGDKLPQLSAQGQAKQQAIQQFGQTYAQIMSQNPGAQREAVLAETLKQLGPEATGNLMVNHPNLFQSADTLHQMLTPSAPKGQYDPKTGQTIFTDPNSGKTWAETTPGATPNPTKAGNASPFPHKIGNNYVLPDPDHPGQFKPALDQNGQPMTAPQKTLSPIDSRYFSVVPQMLKDINILREGGSGTQGFPWGPESALAAKVLGTNDPAIIWNSALTNLKSTIAQGALPSQQSTALKTVLEGLPSTWHAERYNVTNLNMFAGGVRDEAKARIDQAQANGQAVAPSTAQNFQKVGIYPASAGWADPRAMMQAGPQGVKNMSDAQLQWVYNHRNDPSLITPEQSAMAKQETMSRVQQQQGGANATVNAPPQGAAQNGNSNPQPTDNTGAGNSNIQGVAPEATPAAQPAAAPVPMSQGANGATVPIPPAAAAAPQPASPYNPAADVQNDIKNETP